MLAPDPLAPDPQSDNSPDSQAWLPRRGSRPGVAANALRQPGDWINSRRWLLFVATSCVVVSLGAITLRSTPYSSFSASLAESAHEHNLDQRLAQAATAALGDRRGTVIVMDPQTGRVRAVVNSEIAFGENLPAGSTIKPFTVLAALQAGLIDEESHTLCREKYSHDGFQTVCSHPRDMAPLNPTEAIAYSCNYYFGKVGERLNEPGFLSTLSEFGFGKSSGINVAREAQGKLPRNGWHSQNAIGETADLQATPMQLIGAYSALVNGGHLFTPRVASARGYLPEQRAIVEIKDEHRSLIVNGMRGAVRYGTAEIAGLHSLSVYIFGKTGTATQINGFRTQGWFVGFASPLPDHSSKAGQESAPQRVKLAVLVFLTRAHGSEAAQAARPIFEEYARFLETQGHSETELKAAKKSSSDLPFSEAPRLPVAASPRHRLSAAQVSVHLVRENVTRNMSLEEYILGVVAAEGSTEREPEALKALAIASRTYALRNIRRHTSEGYDFCTTTHCQRYRLVDSDSTSSVSAAALQAVRSTKGEVLLDGGNQVADSYFSASCGGATANMSSLWGANAPPYLRGVADEYCASGAHRAWIDVISEKQLLKAMQTDPRTNVGNRLSAIRVSRQDRSGRAQSVVLDGDHRLTVKGWDFKIVVGRALGWNLLKSSRFEVSRSGSNFIFRGSGFGHGLGLCQEGAHVMAVRGANYRQILGKYFPGTHVAKEMELASWDEVSSLRELQMSPPSASDAALPPHSAERLCLSVPGPSFFLRGYASPKRRSHFEYWTGQHSERQSLSAPGGERASESVSQPRTFADLFWSDYAGLKNRNVTRNSRFVRVPVPLEGTSNGLPASRRLTLRSENFRISYPASVNQREIEALLRLLQSSRAALTGRIAGAGVNGQFPALEVFINETTGDFVGRTGQPHWAAAATRGNRIELQPLPTLKHRRILETTLRHEVVHTLVDALGRGRTPRWLAEGLALHLAGEGRMVARYAPARRITTAEIDMQLVSAKSAGDMRVAYAAAYIEVKRLINSEGEANVWRRVAK